MTEQLIGVPEKVEDVPPTIGFPFIGNRFHIDWKEVGGLLINHIAIEQAQPHCKLKPGFMVQVTLINPDDSTV